MRAKLTALSIIMNKTMSHPRKTKTDVDAAVSFVVEPRKCPIPKYQTAQVPVIWKPKALLENFLKKRRRCRRGKLKIRPCISTSYRSWTFSCTLTRITDPLSPSKT